MRRSVDRTERAAPTPELREKTHAYWDGDKLRTLKGDPLEHFLRNAWTHLSPDIDTWNRSRAELACEEISAVYKAVSRLAEAKLMKHGELSGRGKWEMPEGLARAHAERYLPWARETGPKIVGLARTLTVDREFIDPADYPRVGVAILDYAARMR